MISKEESNKAEPERKLAMKIARSCRMKAGATDPRGRSQRICCSLFLVTAVVAAAGAVASPPAKQGLAKLSNLLPANIILVTNTNDNGAGSLRDALAIANEGDTIDATGVSGTILLTSGELQITHSVVISGPEADQLAVDGNAQSRVFYVGPGKTVFVSGLTIRNGNVTNDFGGGIFNDGGALTLSDCKVSDNSAGYGGGISHVSAPHSGFATLTVINSTISGNSGSGIYNSASFGGYTTVTISNSTLSGNSAQYGGGILSGAGGPDQGGSMISISNSTISGNSAVFGGGIYNVGGTLGSAALSVNNSTLSGNSATTKGGGIYNLADFRGSAPVDIRDSILNAGAAGENIFNNAGFITSYGYNLSSDDGGGYLIGPGDQINIDPMLGPLQDNGGPSFTHALLPGSPAIDTGDPSFTPPPFYDQRGLGYPRVVNGRVDKGSFEGRVPRATPTPRPHSTPRPRPS